MTIKPPDASHFFAELGVDEKRIEAYIRYAEGASQLCDNAMMHKEHQQSFKLCLKAGWCVEEYMG
ncbi:MAG TPA: hypothetical protein VJJ78_00255 [Candidatus Saccharimonadales bacterium]|nr:hypothetical protein [Candidatus Saccharimonadales bacterium]